MAAGAKANPAHTAQASAPAAPITTYVFMVVSIPVDPCLCVAYHIRYAIAGNSFRSKAHPPSSGRGLSCGTQLVEIDAARESPRTFTGRGLLVSDDAPECIEHIVGN